MSAKRKWEELDHTDYSFSEPAHSKEDLEKLESIAFNKIVSAFRLYRDYAILKLEKAKRMWHVLDAEYQSLVPDIDLKFNLWEDCINNNTSFINNMLIEANLFDLDTATNEDYIPSVSDMEKVSSTLRQIIREWGSDGLFERSCYKYITDELQTTLPLNDEKLYTKKVLCPGSGLGRLPFEICKLGYGCQGNEFSYFMLITGNFIMNHSTEVNQFDISPYVHQVSNHIEMLDQFRSSKFPDVKPDSLQPGADFSYAAGDFVEVYGSQREEWDAICTCFFLDTAKNIIEYIQVIYNALMPGGRWINIGPLLYHYSDVPGEASIELSLDQVLTIITTIGFVLEKKEMVDTHYTHNEKSMMNTHYKSAFWSATKPSTK